MLIIFSNSISVLLFPEKKNPQIHEKLIVKLLCEFNSIFKSRTIVRCWIPVKAKDRIDTVVRLIMIPYVD